MKNVTLNFVHVSENAFFSKDDKLNIIGIFDKILVADLPALHPSFSISLGISGDKGNHPVTVEIISPVDQKALVSLKGDVNILQDNGNGNLVVNLNGLVFEEVGKYVVKISLEDGSVDESSSVSVEKQ